MRKVMPLWEGAGLSIYLPYMRAVHAQSQLDCGDTDSAFRNLSDALEQVKRPGWSERCDLAEVLRVKACAHAQIGQEDVAEKLFVDALNIAREQSAKSWELRTATHYARLLQAQGRMAEAQSLLQSVYDWFTEGHETRDLKEAGALLSELREVHDAMPTSVSAGVGGQ